MLREISLRKKNAIPNLEKRVLVIVMVVVALLIVYSNIFTPTQNIFKCEITKQGEYVVINQSLEQKKMIVFSFQF